MNNKIILSSTLGILLVLILLVFNFANQGVADEQINTYNNPYGVADEFLAMVKTDSVANFSDDKILSGYSDNIFVGKISKNLGTIKKSEGQSKVPSTKFNVDVLYNIKGYLSGNIDIIQNGGFGSQGILYVYNDIKPFEEGGVYLFTTKGDIYKVGSNSNSSHLLFDATNLDDDKIRGLIRDSEKVAEFRDAYINEDPTLGVEGADFSGPTSYKNLSKSEKEAFENFDNGFVD